MRARAKKALDAVSTEARVDPFCPMPRTAPIDETKAEKNGV